MSPNGVTIGPHAITSRYDPMTEKRLKAFNQIAIKHIEQFGTRDDFKILIEIATHQDNGNCLTLKQLVLGVGIPESTLKRRLGKLVRDRHVLKRMTAVDHRVHCYSLTDKTLKILRELVRDLRAFRWE